MSELHWWNGLGQQWKDAFATTFFHHFNVPTEAEIEKLVTSPVLRLAGPRAAYPNMNFELSDLSGITGLSNLEILVITHHQIKDVTLLQSLANLKGLFIFNNEIESLDGIENLIHLEQLYAQFNKITSLKPLRQLTQLKEVYINNNALNSLEGLTEEHSEKLISFFCKPNDELKQKEIIYTENQLGIKCRTL